MGVDGVEREIGRGRQFDNFGSRGFKLAAEGFVLGLGHGEVWGMVETQGLPVRGALGLVPSGGAGRTNQDALECADHRMSVEAQFWLRPRACYSSNVLNLLRLIGIYMGIMAKATWEGAVLAESEKRSRWRATSIFRRMRFTGIFQTQRCAYGVSVEGHGELLRCRSQWKTECRRGVVLSGAEGGGEADQGVCGVLEGREGGEVSGGSQSARGKAGR